jgi:nucleotide-sensitive chloride channel 1A
VEETSIRPCGRSGYTFPTRNVRSILWRIDQRNLADDLPVQPLFSALSQCSALHLSQLPADQGNSFFGFGNMDDGSDDDEDGDWDDVENGQEEGPEGDGGRVRSDFHSGGGPEARFRPY